MDPKRHPYIHDGNHLLAKMEIIGSMLNLMKITFSILLCLCHRKEIYVDLMALDSLMSSRHTQQPYPTPYHYIFMVPSLPPLMEEQEGIVKQTVIFIVTTIIMVTSISILICIWKQCRYTYVITLSTVSTIQMVMWDTQN